MSGNKTQDWYLSQLSLKFDRLRDTAQALEATARGNET
jgi:hypothetical protein